MDAKSVGLRIKKCRETIDLSQETLGGMIGVSKGSISSYEVGNYYPPIENLLKIAEICKVSPAWLLMGDKLVESIDCHLAIEDLQLLKAFHQADDQNRETILRVAESMMSGKIKSK